MNKPSFIDFWVRFQREERQKKLLGEASTEELTNLWDNWDGMELMKIKEEYVDELGVYCGTSQARSK